MEPVLQSVLHGLPVLLTHFVVTLALLGAGVWVYTRLTPYSEIALIRGGNTAAAVSLSGAILGLAIPLATCMAASVSALDIALWGAITLALQIASYRVADFLLRELPARIESGEIGPAIMLVGIKLSVAALNAAAVTGYTNSVGKGTCDPQMVFLHWQ